MSHGKSRPIFAGVDAATFLYSLVAVIAAVRLASAAVDGEGRVMVIVVACIALSVVWFGWASRQSAAGTDGGNAGGLPPKDTLLQSPRDKTKDPPKAIDLELYTLGTRCSHPRGSCATL